MVLPSKKAFQVNVMPALPKAPGRPGLEASFTKFLPKFHIQPQPHFAGDVATKMIR
jgi:hypothetical protein